MIELAAGVAIGVALGWVIFEKPEWARNLLDQVKSKLPWPRG